MSLLMEKPILPDTSITKITSELRDGGLEPVMSTFTLITPQLVAFAVIVLLVFIDWAKPNKEDRRNNITKYIFFISRK